MLRALRQAVGGDVVAVADAAPPEARREPARNPYKGLRAFRETDAVDFFGRDALVGELIAAVASHNLVTVVGPSGSGKSSVVRAGLIPALRAGGLPASRHWLTTDMYPGSYPFEELEAALLRVAVDRPSGLLTELVEPNGLLRIAKQILPGDDATLVLVVDQFEELFAAVASEATRRLFLDNLVAVATDERSRVRVVLTMRADYFNRSARGAELSGPISRDQPRRWRCPPAAAASRRRRPAAAAGVGFEAGRCSTGSLADVAGPAGQPAPAPVRPDRAVRPVGSTARLTVRRLRAPSAGCSGALARRAEDACTELTRPPSSRRPPRQVFLRLVTVGEEADGRHAARVRQCGARVARASTPGDVDRGASTGFGDARLLTFDRDPLTRGATVEVAHEALLRRWERPTRRAWLDTRREALLLHRRFQRRPRRMGPLGPRGRQPASSPGARLTQYRRRGPPAPRSRSTAAEQARFLEHRDRPRHHRGRQPAAARRRRVTSPGSPPPPSSP